MHATPPFPRRLARVGLAVAALAAAVPVFAQSSDGTGSWPKPGPGRTTIGLQVGRSNFQNDCITGYACDDKGNYVSVYGRNMANDLWGSQLGLVYLETWTAPAVRRAPGAWT